MKILFVILATLGATATAQAGVKVTNDMTCAETLAYSTKYHRVYVRTYTGDVVPIYGYDRACGHRELAMPYWVRTRDNARCVIGHTCYSYR